MTNFYKKKTNKKNELTKYVKIELAKVVKKMRCPVCATENDNSLTYCINCGSPLTQNTNVEPTTTTVKRKHKRKKLSQKSILLILIFGPSAVLLVFIFLLLIILGLLG